MASRDFVYNNLIFGGSPEWTRPEDKLTVSHDDLRETKSPYVLPKGSIFFSRPEEINYGTHGLTPEAQDKLSSLGVDINALNLPENPDITMGLGDLNMSLRNVVKEALGDASPEERKNIWDVETNRMALLRQYPEKFHSMWIKNNQLDPTYENIIKADKQFSWLNDYTVGKDPTFDNYYLENIDSLPEADQKTMLSDLNLLLQHRIGGTPSSRASFYFSPSGMTGASVKPTPRVEEFPAKRDPAHIANVAYTMGDVPPIDIPIKDIPSSSSSISLSPGEQFVNAYLNRGNVNTSAWPSAWHTYFKDLMDHLESIDGWDDASNEDKAYVIKKKTEHLPPFMQVDGVNVGIPAFQTYNTGVSEVPNPFKHLSQEYLEKRFGGDVVPALLTPGEAVIPRESAELFRDEIKEMVDIGREMQSNKKQIFPPIPMGHSGNIADYMSNIEHKPDPKWLKGSGRGGNPAQFSMTGSGRGRNPALFELEGSGRGRNPALFSLQGSGRGTNPDWTNLGYDAIMREDPAFQPTFWQKPFAPNTGVAVPPEQGLAMEPPDRSQGIQNYINSFPGGMVPEEDTRGWSFLPTAEQALLQRELEEQEAWEQQELGVSPYTDEERAIMAGMNAVPQSQWPITNPQGYQDPGQVPMPGAASTWGIEEFVPNFNLEKDSRNYWELLTNQPDLSAFKEGEAIRERDAAVEKFREENPYYSRETNWLKGDMGGRGPTEQYVWDQNMIEWKKGVREKASEIGSDLKNILLGNTVDWNPSVDNPYALLSPEDYKELNSTEPLLKTFNTEYLKPVINKVGNWLDRDSLDDTSLITGKYLPRSEVSLEGQFPVGDADRIVNDGTNFLETISSNSPNGSEVIHKDSDLAVTETKDGEIILSDTRNISPEERSALSNLDNIPDSQNSNKVTGLFDGLKELFGGLFDPATYGLTKQDIMKGLLYYALGLASGGSHGGSLRWAGAQVLNEKIEASKLAAKQGFTVKEQFTTLSSQAEKRIEDGYYTPEGERRVRNAISNMDPGALYSEMNRAENMDAASLLIDKSSGEDMMLKTGLTRERVFKGAKNDGYYKEVYDSNGRLTYVPVDMTLYEKYSADIKDNWEQDVRNHYKEYVSVDGTAEDSRKIQILKDYFGINSPSEFWSAIAPFSERNNTREHKVLQGLDKLLNAFDSTNNVPKPKVTGEGKLEEGESYLSVDALLSSVKIPGNELPDATKIMGINSNEIDQAVIDLGGLDNTNKLMENADRIVLEQRAIFDKGEGEDFTPEHVAKKYVQLNNSITEELKKVNITKEGKKRLEDMRSILAKGAKINNSYWKLLFLLHAHNL